MDIKADFEEALQESHEVTYEESKFNIFKELLALLVMHFSNFIAIIFLNNCFLYQI